MSSSCIISCLAMRNTRRLRRSGRSVRKLYQIQAFMARNSQKRRHCRRRPRRRQFPSWIRRRRAARTKARSRERQRRCRRKRPVNASETQENDVSEQESRPDGTHASKESARESSEAESGGSSPAFPSGNFGTGETENGREKPSGSGSPNGSSAPGSKTDAGIIIE